MDSRVTVDRAGRVSIPKPLRDSLHLRAGDSLEVSADGDAITLKPVRPKALLKRERGVWVFQGEPTDVATPDLIDRVREDRLRDLLG